MLETLYLNDNELEGEIPASIGELSSLLVCNLSNNHLVGVVPDTPVFSRINSSNFVGNIGLCYQCHETKSSNLRRSGGSSSSSREIKTVTIIAMVIGSTSLVLMMSICFTIKRSRREDASFTSLEDQQSHKYALDNYYYFPKEGFSYQNLLEATGSFSEDVVIGRGACGTVYKALMGDGTMIAVKKLKSRGEGPSSSDNSFRAEISTLGKIRHKNIVKLYGFCYHQDASLLLYEYMPNGSLGEHLHGSNNRSRAYLVDWDIRYKIALGAAEGLSYLHYDCKPKIIHRDIKSNNILLDESLQAHVGDFGLAKLIDFSYSKSMSAVAGSYGYIAPGNQSIKYCRARTCLILLCVYVMMFYLD